MTATATATRLPSRQPRPPAGPPPPTPPDSDSPGFLAESYRRRVPEDRDFSPRIKAVETDIKGLKGMPDA
eukprot:3571072-Heterocapsa_arctica.AAC.1